MIKKAILWIGLLGALVGMGFCTRMLVTRSRFESAIEAGDEERVRAFLDAQPSLVKYERSGRRASSGVVYRPLSAAARAGHTRVVALLLDRGADVNATSRGMSALQEGIGHPEVVALLVSRGASVSIRDYQGKTPLHDAGYDGATTRLLIEKGADVNARDRGGRTPLHDQSGRFCPESTVDSAPTAPIPEPRTPPAARRRRCPTALARPGCRRRAPAGASPPVSARREAFPRQW